MFEEIPNMWTPVLLSRELGDKPKAVVLAGVNLVVYRVNGEVGTLLEHCPHRGVSLALGKVKEGCLECPFHGWQFKTNGECAHVPLNPEAKKDNLKTRAFPTRDLAGLIWVFTGEVAEGEPVVPEALTRKGTVLDYRREVWQTHWTRAMENMLDFPHLPWVHGKSIGKALAKSLRRDSRVFQEITPDEHGFRLDFRMDDHETNNLWWRRPNAMVLNIMDQPGRYLRVQVFCVPEKTNYTQMILISASDFGFFNIFAPLSKLFAPDVLMEDKAVLESSWPMQVPAPADEKSVATDKGTLVFRTWYRKLMRQAAAGSPEERGEVVELNS